MVRYKWYKQVGVEARIMEQFAPIISHYEWELHARYGVDAVLNIRVESVSEPYFYIVPGPTPTVNVIVPLGVTVEEVDKIVKSLLPTIADSFKRIDLAKITREIYSRVIDIIMSRRDVIMRLREEIEPKIAGAAKELSMALGPEIVKAIERLALPEPVRVTVADIEDLIHDIILYELI